MSLPWRVAESLLTLRSQIDAKYPNRSKVSDGAIGDEDHQNRDSDHNPWYGPGIVTAMDITHDPGNGVDIDSFTDELAASRDPRIKYIIANGLILDTRPRLSPWQWAGYDGPNEHTRHFHLSVVASPLCDDAKQWDIPSLRVEDNEVTPEDIDAIANRILHMPIERKGTGQSGFTSLHAVTAWSDYAWELGRTTSYEAATRAHGVVDADAVVDEIAERLAA